MKTLAHKTSHSTDLALPLAHKRSHSLDVFLKVGALLISSSLLFFSCRKKTSPSDDTREPEVEINAESPELRAWLESIRDNVDDAEHAGLPRGFLRDGEHLIDGRPGDGLETEEAGRRSPTFRPDRTTSLESEVNYFEVFSPAISPFKRMTALSEVVIGDDGVPFLKAPDGVHRSIPVVSPTDDPSGGGPDAIGPDGRTREAFLGSVVLDFRASHTVPFPSVSPESRILSFSTEPHVSLRFEKDRADNFFAVLDPHETENLRIRVVFSTDAPSTYFRPQLLAVHDPSLAREASPLPATLLRDAQTIAAEIGVSSSKDWSSNISTLTQYFRSFVESREPPANTGNIYLDLARGKRGVCRHRAFAFVITALGIGIPARFVQNEAHAWVEVLGPNYLGWVRIDLGGSPGRLRARGPSNAPVFRNQADPFPKPQAYVDAYARASDSRRQAQAAADPYRNGFLASGSTQDGESTVNGLRVELQVQEEAAHRNEPVLVEGRVIARGSEGASNFARSNTDSPGLSGLRIEVYARSAQTQLLLGVTTTHVDGRFEMEVGIPPELPLGDYRVVGLIKN